MIAAERRSEVATREVLQLGDPALRESAMTVEDIQYPGVRQTMRDLRDTLHDLQRIHGRGGGLAAPQIGSSWRIVYINARGRSFFLLNPKVVEKSNEMFDVWDFCFSARAAFLARIQRHRRIVVEYQDVDGVNHSEEFDGYFSELLQHEIDHLHGVLFIDLIDCPETITMVEEWDKAHHYSLNGP
jgi:peptide deformylase